MQNMHFPKLTTTNCIYILAFYWHLNNNSLLDNGWARQNFQNWFCCCGSKVYPRGNHATQSMGLPQRNELKDIRSNEVSNHDLIEESN